MPPKLNAMLCAVMPFVAVHIAYLGHIMADTVPACFPYVEGCLTVSRAARSGEMLFIFRALMMPSVALIISYWIHCFVFLKILHGENHFGTHAMRLLGIIGALFLILYVTYLGSDGEVYRWMRRYGIIFYFSFTALAQLLFTQSLFRAFTLGSSEKVRSLLNIKLALCAFQWGIGLVSLALDFIIEGKENRDTMHNIIEWNFAFAMNAFFFVSYRLFKALELKQNLTLDRQ